MERPADDIFLVNDLSVLKSPVPRHLFEGRPNDATSAQTTPAALRQATGVPNAAGTGQWQGKILSPGSPPVNLGLTTSLSPPSFFKQPENRPSLSNARPPVPSAGSPSILQGLPKPEPKPAVPVLPQSTSSSQPPTATLKPECDPQGAEERPKRKRGRPPKAKVENAHPKKETVFESSSNAATAALDNSHADSTLSNTGNGRRGLLSVEGAGALPAAHVDTNNSLGTIAKNRQSVQDAERQPPTVNPNTSTSDKPKVIELTDWSLATVPNSPKLTGVPVDEQQFWVVLVGRRPDMAEAWHSSIVTERLAADSIKTGSGRSVYLLRGPINQKDMYDSGFSEPFIKAFTHGFPEQWRRLLLQELTRMTRALATGQVVKRGSTLAAAAVTPNQKPPCLDMPRIDQQDISKEVSRKSSVNDPQAAIEQPIKRKRGRPRKYPGPGVGAKPAQSPDVPAAALSPAPSASERKKSKSEAKEEKVTGLVEARGRGRKRTRPTAAEEGGEEEREADVDYEPLTAISDKTAKANAKGSRAGKKFLEKEKRAALTQSVYTPPPRASTSRRRSGPGSGLVKWGWGGKAIIQTLAEEDLSARKRS